MSPGGNTGRTDSLATSQPAIPAGPQTVAPATATSPERIFEKPNGLGEVRAVYDAARSKWGVADSGLVYLAEDPSQDPARMTGRATREAIAAAPRQATGGYEDAVIRKFVIATTFWGVVAFLVGVVAAAGTHVISREAGLAVVGNVLTHADHRGRGYAKAVTSAVTAELLRFCDQVVLNVRADNPPALQAYRRLGYREHVRFEERLVHRMPAAGVARASSN